MGKYTATPETLKSQTKARPPSWRTWIACLVLAFLFHFLLLQMKWKRSPPLPSAPVEVQKIDPRRLEALRKIWRKKTLLLNKNPEQKSSTTADPDARYFSDKNIRVEKEKKAQRTSLIPDPGSTGSRIPLKPATNSATPPLRKKITRHKEYPKLGNLAVPFKFESSPQPPPLSSALSNGPFRMPTGQALDDDHNLPMGAENLLNTRESLYYSFYARIYETVGPLWSSMARSALAKTQVSPGEYVTIVDIVLDENGNLREIRRIYSSGIDVLDQAVEDAWEKTARMPNPPRGLLDRERQTRISWKYIMRVGR